MKIKNENEIRIALIYACVLLVIFLGLSGYYYLHPQTVEILVVDKSIEFSSQGNAFGLYSAPHYFIKDSYGNVYETNEFIFDEIKSCNSYIVGLKVNNKHTIIRIMPTPANTNSSSQVTSQTNSLLDNSAVTCR